MCSQLKKRTSAGTEMIIVSSMKLSPSIAERPVVNMWCPYTTADRMVTVSIAPTEKR